MSGLLLLFALIAIGWVVLWSINNDGALPDRTRGLFAMRRAGQMQTYEPANSRPENTLEQ